MNLSTKSEKNISKTKKPLSLSSILADIGIYIFLILFLLVVLFPFYNMLIISFATNEDLIRNPFYIIPLSFTLTSYIQILNDPQMISSTLVALHNVVTGTIMSLIITIFAAYGLSRKDLPFKRVIFYFVVFTMFFSGGLIPWYLVLQSLGFVNSIWVMTVPGMLSTFNMILVRNYFFSLPESLEEAARLDGAGEFVIMWRVFVPLSKPIIATVALFYAVAFWNEWWNAMLFIQRESLLPLALILRRVVIENVLELGTDAVGMGMLAGVARAHPRSLQMATVAIATLPILCVYPFLQKYFTKGIMLGSIKA